MTTDDTIPALLNRPPFEVTMEKFILTFAWVADEAGHSREAISDLAWLLWQAWVAVEKYDGWSACPAVAAALGAADYRNSPLSITEIPQGMSGAAGLI